MMKRYSLLTWLLLAVLAATGRERVNLNFEWEFSRDKHFSHVEQVNLPHDFQISQPWVAPAADEKADNSNAAANVRSRLSARGFKEMGTGWYRKVITPDDSWRGRRVLLDFEGIMYVGDVYLNGKLIGSTDYGYVGFEIDITNLLRYGQPNELKVMSSTMKPENSRWYTGGGLFRNVSIVTTDRNLYFGRHALYITTRDNRYVTVSAEVTDRTKGKATRMRLCIYDPNGNMVAECATTKGHHRQSRTQDIKTQELEIMEPLLWDTEHPHLYKVVAQLLNDDDTVADEVSDDFGIRTIEVTPDHGLLLNGKKVLLKGYANHHTLGALGAAAYPRAIEKRILLMKQFGINHIRTSHNPYSRDFIRLCDKHGILVVDELYDKWTRQHTGGRASFDSHWMYDVPEWVKRDRNSPSVVMWSLGNELQQDPNQPFNDWGVTCYKMMKPVLQRYDSTRLVTVAMHPRYRNWETDSLPCDLAMLTDVQAYNYRYMYFPGDGRRFPWMRFYQSEASVSAMGLNFYEMNLDRVIGLAYWGAIDYLGESQGWPDKGWRQGVFDISLLPKPKAWLMKSMFSEEPVVHIGIVTQENNAMWNGVQTGNNVEVDHWNFQEGNLLNITTYTNADEVELLVNGKSIGRQQNNRTVGSKRNRISWKVEWKKGSLEAVARTNGKVVARHRIETAGEAVALKLEADNSHWQADGMDLQHIRITAVDKKGRRVPMAEQSLTFDIKGNAQKITLSNGDITTDEIATADHIRLFQGAAMLILRAGREAGSVDVKVSAPGLRPAQLTLHTNP